MSKAIEQAVLESLREAVAIHEGTAKPTKSYTVFNARRLPAEPAPIFSASRITQLRHQLQCSQPAFASLLNVSAPTVRAWEQNQRKPHGAAARLLQVLAAKPTLFQGVMTAPVVRSKGTRKKSA